MVASLATMSHAPVEPTVIANIGSAQAMNDSQWDEYLESQRRIRVMLLVLIIAVVVTNSVVIWALIALGSAS